MGNAANFYTPGGGGGGSPSQGAAGEINVADGNGGWQTTGVSLNSFTFSLDANSGTLTFGSSVGTLTINGGLSAGGGVTFTGLPASDPMQNGVLWYNSLNLYAATVSQEPG